MAIYHFTASKGQKGKQSARAKHAYITRSGKYAADDLVISESGNMPSWANSSNEYWQAADEHERANGRLFRSYEFSLPIELDQKAQLDLARSFCRELATAPEGNLPYSFAIHHGDGKNPHCHLMISERVNDGISRTAESWFRRANKKDPEKGGALKAESLEKKERLFEIRRLWAERTNAQLSIAGHTARIDHRSLVDQGIDRLAQLHIGPHVLEMEAKGIITDKGSRADERYREIERSKEITGIGRPDRAFSPEHGPISGRPARENERSGEHDLSNSAKQHQNRRIPANSFEVPEKFSTEVLSDSWDYSFDNCDSSTSRICNLAEPIRNRRFAERDSEFAGEVENTSGVGEASSFMAEHGKKSEEFGRGQQAVTSEIGNKTDNGERAAKTDRTTEAVKNQIRAMSCKKFEIGVKNQKGMINKEYDPEELIKAIPWLKRMNAQGNDIYIRPAESEQSPLILVDDLEPIQIEEMKESGLSPALVIETSYKNCQAWVKLPSKTLSDALRGDIAKKLAKDLGADPASAEKRHYGRLAGFTNRKEKYLTSKGFPYVLCRLSSGEVAKKGQILIDEAKTRQLEAQELAKARQIERERIKFIENAKTWHFSKPTAEEAFKKYMREWLERQENKPDWSKGDYAVACRMAKEQYRPEDISEAIKLHSPSIDIRKLEHSADYAKRTVEAAFNDKSVIDALRAKELERQKTMERNRSRGGIER